MIPLITGLIFGILAALSWYHKCKTRWPRIHDPLTDAADALLLGLLWFIAGAGAGLVIEQLLERAGLI